MQRWPTHAGFPDDDLLREAGFCIHSRPERGEVLWVKKGRVFSQSSALEAVRSERAKKIKQLEAKFSGK